jgi:hypothetical protein
MAKQQAALGGSGLDRAWSSSMFERQRQAPIMAGR